MTFERRRSNSKKSTPIVLLFLPSRPNMLSRVGELLLLFSWFDGHVEFWQTVPAIQSIVDIVCPIVSQHFLMCVAFSDSMHIGG